MTFRAKPVVKRGHKPSWESQDRRNFYLNLGFGIVVAAAVVILIVAVAASYYTDHLASVGNIAGESISKDDLRDRVLIEDWRLQETERRIRTQTQAGMISQAQADAQAQSIASQRESLDRIALERIIDDRIQADLAVEEGITVTDADIEARFVEEATTPELRHLWQIEIEPEISDGAIEPTEEQIAAARTKAEAALKDLRSGKTWDEVAKTVSTDTATAPQAGDLGWLTARGGLIDEALLTALFEATVDTPTAVVEGDDGRFRIGRVSEIRPESVDAAYQSTIVNDGIDMAKYREVVRADATRQKLQDKVVADATKPGPQRETSQIYLSQDTVDLPDEAVKVRHILFSPNDDPNAASAGDIPPDDPAWGQAKLDAEAAYARLKADPSAFDEVARTDSDEESARGEDGTGGVLDAYVSEDADYVPTFLRPILDAKPTDGQLLEPIKTDFGWHVVQVMRHAPDLAAIKAEIDGGADFATIAADVSESQEGALGGKLGWVARGQFEGPITDAIFAAPIGGTSAVVAVPNEGSYLFAVTAEEERTPVGRQLEALKSTAFSDWYDLKKGAIPIVRDPALTGFEG